MGKALDLTGQRFGRLTAQACVVSKNGKRFWACSCQCGNWLEVSTGDLRSGHTTSCGCTRVEKLVAHNFKHGAAVGRKVTTEYSTWHRLLTELPAEWRVFTNFLRDLGCRPSEQHQIARRDEAKPHGLGNTYWHLGHGMSQSPEGTAWRQLRSSYEDIPPEWDDFVQFFCDVGERPSPKHYLSKRDGQKPHGPTNTYWRNPDDYTDLTATDLGSDFVVDLRSLALAEAAAREGAKAA